MKEVIIVILVILCVILTFWLAKELKGRDIRTLESYLVAIGDPNWVVDYGVDTESRLVYNVALLNQIVNNQGNVLAQMLEDPNL